VDIRKIIIILVIGALFAFFVNALIEAVYPSPDYNDYCEDRAPLLPGEMPGEDTYSPDEDK